MVASVRIATARVDFGANPNPYIQGVRRLRAENRRLQSSYRRIRRDAALASRTQDQLAGRIRALASAAGAAALARVGERAITATAALGKFAETIGFGVEALQELRFAGEQYASLAERTVDLALQRFSRRVGEAANGTGEAKAALEEMGITLVDTEGRLRPMQAILADVADFMANAESQSTRLRLAFKLFDSEGARFVRVLQEGSDGLVRMRNEARATGGVLGSDLVQSAVELDERLINLRNTLRGGITRAVLNTAAAWQALAGAGGAVVAVIGTRLVRGLTASARAHLTETTAANAAAVANARLGVEKQRLAVLDARAALTAANVARSQAQLSTAYANTFARAQAIGATVASQAAATRALSAEEGKLTAAINARTAATTRANAATSLAGTVARRTGATLLAALGGPVGAIIAGLSVAIGLWAAFGDSVRRAAGDTRRSTADIVDNLNQIADAQRSIAEGQQGNIRRSQNEAQLRQADLFVELAERRLELAEYLQERERSVLGTLGATGSDARTRQLQGTIERLEEDIANINTALGNVDRQAAAARRSVSNVVEGAPVLVPIQLDLQSAQRDAEDFIRDLRRDLQAAAQDQAIDLAATGLGAGDAARVRTQHQIAVRFGEQLAEVQDRLAAARRGARAAADAQAAAERELATATVQTRQELERRVEATRQAAAVAAQRVIDLVRERTETEALAPQIRELIELYGKLAESQGEAAAAQQQAAQNVQQAADAFTQASQAAESGIRRTEDALVQLATRGRFSFRDFVDGIIEDITRLIIRLQITGPLLERIRQAIQARQQQATQAAQGAAQAASGAQGTAQASAQGAQAACPPPSFFAKLSQGFQGIFGGFFGKLNTVFRGLFGGWLGRLLSLMQGFLSSLFAAVGGAAGGLRNLLPFRFGGIVPGRAGEPRLVQAHGGERISPPGSAGGGALFERVEVNVYNSSQQPVAVRRVEGRQDFRRAVIGVFLEDDQTRGPMFRARQRGRLAPA